MRTQPDYIIRRLEEHASRLDKEAIIADAVNEDLPEFFEGLKMALDPLVTFGVKKVPIKKTDDTSQGMSWSVFCTLANSLRDRELTGHAARDAIQLAMEVATQRQWNDWYRRILIKDLRCGVSEKTVNKVVTKLKRTDLAIPIFSCMLAHDTANHENKMKGKKQLEFKLDGVRTLAVIHDTEGKRIELLSRSGKQFHNFDHVIENIRAVLKENPAPFPLVLDGEIMSASFQALMKQLHRKDTAIATDAVLYLFDTIPLADFMSKKYSKPQTDRSKITKAWVEQHQATLDHVRFLDSEVVDLDTDEGQARFKEFNRIAIENKFEGVMIKDIKAPYVCKRAHSWLKAKPYIEVTLEIIDAEEGTGRNEGRLGAFICAGKDDGKDIVVSVGGGYTDDQRISFWNSWIDIIGRSKLKGSLVEVRADAVTQNQDGTYSLRFPRFKTFRGFESGEKL